MSSCESWFFEPLDAPIPPGGAVQEPRVGPVVTEQPRQPHNHRREVRGATPTAPTVTLSPGIREVADGKARKLAGHTEHALLHPRHST
jgi:hypothetical protein